MSARAAPGRVLAIVASIVVAATLVAAVLTMGSPSEQRDIKLDARRTEDLRQLEHAAKAYFIEHQSLPADMAALVAQTGWDLSSVDPLDGQPYVYAVTGERSYQLCARFTTDTAVTGQADVAAGPDQWNHGTGRQCFKRSVTKLGE